MVWRPVVSGKLRVTIDFIVPSFFMTFTLIREVYRRKEVEEEKKETFFAGLMVLMVLMQR